MTKDVSLLPYILLCKTQGRRSKALYNGNRSRNQPLPKVLYVVIDNNLIAKIQVSPSDFLLNLKKQDETVQLPEQDIPISLSPC